MRGFSMGYLSLGSWWGVARMLLSVGSMAHPSNNESTNEIIERATAVSLGEAQSAHPMVLSCGGLFVPRPRRLNPRDPLYVILHTPATEVPTKIVSACVSKGPLDVALGKERLN